jgi:hypothetical protein
MNDIPSGYASGDVLRTELSSAPALSVGASRDTEADEQDDTALPLPDDQSDTAQAAPVDARPAANEVNLRQLRQEREQLKRERDEAIRFAQEIQQRYTRPAEPAEEVANLKDDDIPEWRHVAKEVNSLRKEINQYKQQSTQSLAETKLKAEFPDLHTVVTDDNLRLLRESDPDLADSILANPNTYSQYATAYRAIKRFGIYQEPNPDRDRALRNATKPRPVASVSPQRSESPLTQVNAFSNGLTPELQKALLKEMIESSRRRDGS